MKIGIVAPSPVPFTRGGAERAWAGQQHAINELTPHDAELVKLPIREDTLPHLVEGYRDFAELDVSHFDVVITSKYPAWLVRHPHHVVWMFHPLRGLYDTYRVFGLPELPDPRVSEVRALVQFLRRPPRREDLDELFDMSDRLAVMHGGKVVGVVDPRTADRYTVGRMMLGTDHSAAAGQMVEVGAA